MKRKRPKWSSPIFDELEPMTHSGPHLLWAHWERKFLSEVYATHSCKWIAEKLERTPKAVYEQAFAMGLKGRGYRERLNTGTDNEKTI